VSGISQHTKTPLSLLEFTHTKDKRKRVQITIFIATYSQLKMRGTFNVVLHPVLQDEDDLLALTILLSLALSARPESPPRTQLCIPK
jgi:hypothetical protein